MLLTDADLLFYMRDVKDETEIHDFIYAMQEKGFMYKRDYRINRMTDTIKIFHTAESAVYLAGVSTMVELNNK